MPALWFPYSASATLYFGLIGSGTAARSTAGSGSLVGTNIRIGKDGAAFATSTNTGSAYANGFFFVVLTDTELAAKQIVVDIAGSGATLGTLVESQAFLIHTYGSASAMYPFIGAGSGGTALVNLVANQSTATIGTVAFVATGTITTLINVASANLVQILGTAAVGTSGTLTNVGTVTTPGSANLTQILGTAVVATAGTLTNIGTAGLLLTGTVTTVINTVTATLAGVASANVVQILGTAAVATAGTFTNVGTVTTPGSANLTQILGTAVVATAGTLTNVGTVGTALGTINANVVLLQGTSIAGTQGTAIVNLAPNQTTATVGTVNVVGTVGTVTGTVGVNILAINGTAAAAALLALAAGAQGSGTATGTRNAAAFEVSGLTQAATDHWKGRVVIFKSGTMEFEASDITAYRGSSVGTLGQLTVTTLTRTPADGVSFIVI